MNLRGDDKFRHIRLELLMFPAATSKEPELNINTIIRAAPNIIPAGYLYFPTGIISHFSLWSDIVTERRPICAFRA